MRNMFGRFGGSALVALACGALAAATPLLAQPAPTPAYDQSSGPIDPERLALARDYVREAHMDTMMKGVMRNVLRQFPGASSSDPKMQQFITSYSAGMDAALPDVIDASAEGAARTFTVGELKDLVAFYGSPTGQAVLEKMPQLMQATMPLIINKILPKVFAATETDYCAHLECTAEDHARFARMMHAMSPDGKGSDAH